MTLRLTTPLLLLALLCGCTAFAQSPQFAAGMAQARANVLTLTSPATKMINWCWTWPTNAYATAPTNVFAILSNTPSLTPPVWSECWRGLGCTNTLWPATNQMEFYAVGADWK